MGLTRFRTSAQSRSHHIRLLPRVDVVTIYPGTPRCERVVQVMSESRRSRKITELKARSVRFSSRRVTEHRPCGGGRVGRLKGGSGRMGSAEFGSADGRGVGLSRSSVSAPRPPIRCSNLAHNTSLTLSKRGAGRPVARSASCSSLTEMSPRSQGLHRVRQPRSPPSVRAQQTGDVSDTRAHRRQSAS